jgi:hypothetical protein
LHRCLGHNQARYFLFFHATASKPRMENANKHAVEGSGTLTA